jgi:hypothetical protein
MKWDDKDCWLIASDYSCYPIILIAGRLNLRKFILFFTILTILICLIGCSGKTNDPIITQTEGDLPETVFGNPGHNLIGIGEIIIDPETNQAEVLPRRDLADHLNITTLLPAVGITINSINWVTGIADVDVKITNPYAISGYDVRFILYTNTNGLEMVNDDGWTDLYDIAGGKAWNPFKAYNKSEVHRIFWGQSQSTENLQIFLPNPIGPIVWAIDASYPYNCLEPYAFQNFAQGELLETVGSSCDLSVKVLDWQDNVATVSINAIDITGTWYTHFTYDAGTYMWNTTLTNSQGADNGTYKCLIVSTSTGASTLLYDYVTITIGASGCPADSNSNCTTASDLGFDDLINGCVDSDADPEDWYHITAPPNGIIGGSINLEILSGTPSMIVYSTNDDGLCPGTLIAFSTSVSLTTRPDIHYYVRVFSTSGRGIYRISTDITPAITQMPCEIYVATTGAPNYDWPIYEQAGPDVELSVSNLLTQIQWSNNFWQQYGYKLVWDGSVTLMSSQYYILNTSEEAEEMHNTYGRGTDKISLYFVDAVTGMDTAYCVPRTPKSMHNVDNVYTVYSPTVWTWQQAIAHEHGHALGYLIDEYLFDMYSLPCGDTSGFPGGVPKYLYADPLGCYQGNMMFYGVEGWSWTQYDLTSGQHNYMNWFQYAYPDNWPKL